jgi:hypothetical protein
MFSEEGTRWMDLYDRAVRQAYLCYADVVERNTHQGEAYGIHVCYRLLLEITLTAKVAV